MDLVETLVIPPGGGIQTITGNSGGAVGPNMSNNVNLLGSGQVSVTGNPGTNTLTISLSDAIATTYTANSGSATPSANNLNVLATVATAGTTPFTSVGAGSTITYTVQRSQAIAASDATKIGLSNFDSAAFDVDANGFVQLNGGGIAATAFDVQANTAPGTDPVVPSAAGVVIVNGAAVANHSVVLETRSRAVNAYNLEVQYATTAASTDATKSGVAHFDSSAFTVDANGFVALVGASAAIEKVNVQTGTTPTVPSSGAITFNGAVVAAGTNPVRTDGTGANTMALEVQISQSLAASDATKIGLCNFDSASFSVDANGFVSLAGGDGFTWSDASGTFTAAKNNGYFITGTSTANLPASPAQGDTIKFFLDHASQALTIDAPGTQLIRLGNQVTSAGGTFVSTAQGDSVELTYRSSDTCWCAIAGFSGTWTFT